MRKRMIGLFLNPNPATKAKKEITRQILVLSGGSLGCESASYLRGQVVFRKTTAKMAAGTDFFTGLGAEEEHKLSPLRDIQLSPVSCPSILVQIRAENSSKIIYTTKIQGDKNGFFKHEIGQKLKAGIHEVSYLVAAEIAEYYFSSIIQSGNERYLLAGKSHLRILADAATLLITTSDIDQTWLETPLHSFKGKILTLFETAEEKKEIAGMAELYSSLKRFSKGSPLSFISASPHFYRRTFFSKFSQDKIQYDSLHLKYLQGTIQELFSMLQGKIRLAFSQKNFQWKKEFSELKKSGKKYYQSLFDQIPYKLSILLHNRIYHPTGAREILLGDDTESDYLIYTLYQLLLSGKIKAEETEEFLLSLEFNGKSSITKESARTIRNYTELCRKRHGNTNPVISVLINHTDIFKSRKYLYRQVLRVLPKNLQLDSINGFKLFTLTDGALGFAVSLHSQNLLNAQSVINVAKSIAENKNMDKNRFVEVFAGLDLLNLGRKTRQLLEQIVKMPELAEDKQI